MSNINLLPWRIEHKKKKKNTFLLILALSSLAVIGISSLGKVFIDMKISAQNQRNQFLQKQILILDRKLVEIKAIKKQKLSLERRIKAIQTLEKKRNLVTRLFNTLVDVTPKGVYIDGVTYSGHKISLNGLSESNKRLAKMIRNIDGSGWLNDAHISSVVAGPLKPMKLNKFSMSFVVSREKSGDK